MKNLKKVLALVMAFACAFTMFASAATVDFSDKADIKNQDAVNMLVALNVINGYEDGTFKPTGNVTRAEMAKMIYIIRTGGSANADTYKGATSTFTDLDDEWSRGFIKYCQNAKIIAGKSDTIFAPKGNVTVQETAKMALVVLGYRADKAGLTGANWVNNTLNLASENKLLDGVNTAVDQPATRDDAARILYNLLDADVVVWSNDKEEFVKDTVTVGNAGSTKNANRTAGEKYMGLAKTVGVLTSLEKVEGSTGYEIMISNINEDDSAPNSEGKYLDNFTKVTTDYSAYKHQQVKVLYKSKTEVYGVYPTNNNVSLSGVLGNFEMDNTRLKFDDKKYTVDSKAVVKVDNKEVSIELAKFVEDYAKNGLATTPAENYIAKAYNTVAVSNSDSAKVNLMNVETFQVGKVTFIGKDYINVNIKVGADAGKTVKYTDADATWYTDVKKDDYVAVTAAVNTSSDKNGIAQLELVKGKITWTDKSQSDAGYKVKVGDTKLEMAMNDSSSTSTAQYGNEKIGVNDSVAVVVKDGYIVWIDSNKAVVDNIVLVQGILDYAGYNGTEYQARIINADGKSEDVVVSKINDADPAPYAGDGPFLASYSKSGSKYKLTVMGSGTGADQKLGGFDKYEERVDAKIDANKFTGGATDVVKYIDADATVFVREKNKDNDYTYKVITGKTLRSWNDKATFDSKVLSTESNGTQYAKVAFIDITDGKSSAGDAVYGYVMSWNMQTMANGSDGVKYVLWNGTEEVTAYSEDTGSGDILQKGTVVEYTLDSDNYIDTTLEIAKGDWKYVGVITDVPGGFNMADMKGDITVYDYDLKDSETVRVDYKEDDSFVLFVNSKKSSKADGGYLTKSETSVEDYKQGTSSDIKNVAVYDNGKLRIVVIDTQGDLEVGNFR